MNHEIREKCPFCKGDGVLQWEFDRDSDQRWYVICVSCAGQGPWDKTKTGAIRLWNERATIDSAIDRAIKELPPDYEISVTLANDAWIVDLEVPDRTQETLGTRRHIATAEDCPIDHAISEAVEIAKLLEEREP